jgi:hypothetical protein
MNLIIIGIDHLLQKSNACLKNFIATITESEQPTLIGEEAAGDTVARQVAGSKGIRWIEIDVDPQQRMAAGIGQKLINRMQVRYETDGTVVQRIRYAPTEDGIREDFWLKRIAEEQDGGTALIVCGALHARKLSEKAKQRGHDTKLFFHPDIPGSQLWISIMPELF